VSVVDARLPALVLFVKHWAKVQGINDASQGTCNVLLLLLLSLLLLLLSVCLSACLSVCVSVVDARLPALVLFVKHWAKVQGINDASQGTVSSYSLVLMVIHYLQCMCYFHHHIIIILLLLKTINAPAKQDIVFVTVQ